MIIYYSTKFLKDYKKLPIKIKKLAEKSELKFRKDPHDHSLKTHTLTGKLKGFWSFSINYQYRIVFEFASKKTVWFHAVGAHDIYR